MDLFNAIFQVLITIIVIIILITASGYILWLFRPLINFYNFYRRFKKGEIGIKDPIILRIELPQTATFGCLSFAETLNTLHSLLFTKNKFGVSQKNFFSLEIVSIGPNIYFIIVTSKQYQRAIESQIYANYPNAEISFIRDYTGQIPEGLKPAFAELKLKYNEIFPLKIYDDQSEKKLDPLSKIAGFLSRSTSNEFFWLQIPLYPESNKWYLRGFSSIKNHLWPQHKNQEQANNKLKQRLFRSRIRMIYWAKDENTADTMLKNIINIFKDFSGTNKFDKAKLPYLKKKIFLDLYRARVFEGKGYLLAPNEITGLYHYSFSQENVPNIAKVTSRHATPPDKLPLAEQYGEDDLSVFGETNFRNEMKKFGIKRKDRRRHFYIIGKSGMGKSKMLELLISSDLRSGQGLTLIDPHGETAELMLKFIPKDRIKDTIYFNPSDRDFPIALNILESTKDVQRKHIITASFVAIFKKLFYDDWSPRMAQITRYSILAALESHDCSILTIPKLLTDKKFRQKIIAQIDDPIVKNFWTTEFLSWSDRFASEAIIPLLNKIGQFLSNPAIRNCVAQSNSAINFDKILNDGKIFIVNLSKGQLGDENSALLGAMIITKLQEAALSRASIPEESRKDHYLYIDEFQNFATSAFITILSEARKYHLNLTIAHQFLGQVDPEIRGAIFGNVSSLAAFRIGAEDSTLIEKEFNPVFKANDFLNLNFREMYLKLSIDGQTTQPFSAKTITLDVPGFDYASEVIDYSRKNYAQPRNMVETNISKVISGEEADRLTNVKFEEPII